MGTTTLLEEPQGVDSSVERRGSVHPADDPEVRAHLDSLQMLLRGKYGDASFEVVLCRTHNSPSTPLPKVPIGGSPGDWYDHEDQMSRPGMGKQEHMWQ